MTKTCIYFVIFYKVHQQQSFGNIPVENIPMVIELKDRNSMKEPQNLNRFFQII